jgi:hypothetical protein
LNSPVVIEQIIDHNSALNMQSKDLQLDKIDIYGGTQARAATNDDT